MKYIIDIPDDRIGDYVGSTHLLMPYIVAGHKGHYDTELELTPYTEPDRKAIEDEVWSFVNFMAQEMDTFARGMCFNKEHALGIVRGMTYQEAKAKYEAWKKQKDEIHVGDEIVGIYSDGDKTPPLVVLKVEGNYYYGIYSKTGGFVQGGLNYEKTGRHFDEVEELLQKMRGGEQ